MHLCCDNYNVTFHEYMQNNLLLRACYPNNHLASTMDEDDFPLTLFTNNGMQFNTLNMALKLAI